MSYNKFQQVLTGLQQVLNQFQQVSTSSDSNYLDLNPNYQTLRTTLKTTIQQATPSSIELSPDLAPVYSHYGSHQAQFSQYKTQAMAAFWFIHFILLSSATRIQDFLDFHQLVSHRLAERFVTRKRTSSEDRDKMDHEKRPESGKMLKSKNCFLNVLPKLCTADRIVALSWVVQKLTKV